MSTSQITNRPRRPQAAPVAGRRLPAHDVHRAPVVAGSSRSDGGWHAPSWTHGGSFRHRMGFAPAWQVIVGRATRWALVAGSIGIVGLAMVP